MACLFLDGFDWYLTGDLSKRYTGTAGGVSLSTATTRLPSTQSLVTSTNQASLSGSCGYKSFGTNYTQGCVGFAVQTTLSFVSKRLFVIGDGTSEQISVGTNASSVLTVNRGATLLATGTTVLSINTWYYVELKFSISAAAGTVLVQLNGSTETLTYATGTSTTQNTRSTANTQWNAFGYGNLTSGFIDDVYVLDTSTGSNTTFLGAIRVATLSPAAPGNYAQWTPNGGTNYGNVSETFEDGDTSFNQSATANQIDSFAMQDLPVSSGNVYAVQHLLVARQDAGAARKVKPLLRIGSTDYAGTAQNLSSSYQFLQQVYDVSPATSTAWTTSEVAGFESGYDLDS